MSSADFCSISVFSRRIPSVSKSLDSDQVGRFIGPGLGPNCLQRLSEESADDTIMGKDQYRS